MHELRPNKPFKATRPLRLRAHILKPNSSGLKNSMQEQIHGLCCKQLSIRSWCNRRELPHVIGPCEFNLKSAASSIVTKAANLNIIHGLTCDVQRLNAVHTIANPFPALLKKSPSYSD